MNFLDFFYHILQTNHIYIKIINIIINLIMCYFQIYFGKISKKVEINKKQSNTHAIKTKVQMIDRSLIMFIRSTKISLII